MSIETAGSPGTEHSLALLKKQLNDFDRPYSPDRDGTYQFHLDRVLAELRTTLTQLLASDYHDSKPQRFDHLRSAADGIAEAFFPYIKKSIELKTALLPPAVNSSRIKARLEQ